MTDNYFKNKNILVAGASSGIGKTTAVSLSNAGANVILVSRSEEKLNSVLTSELSKGNHSCYSFDFKNTENISDLINQIMSSYENIDGIVYSVGASKKTRFNKLTTDLLDYIMRVNFYSFVGLVTSVAKIKAKENELRVVAISSLASSENTKFFLPYASSKSALECSIRILANELKRRNVFISGVKPAYVDTPRIWRNNELCGDFNKYLMDGYQPFGLIPPSVISDAICMLLGPNAKYYSGSCVKIPAGASC